MEQTAGSLSLSSKDNSTTGALGVASDSVGVNNNMNNNLPVVVNVGPFFETTTTSSSSHTCSSISLAPTGSGPSFDSLRLKGRYLVEKMDSSSDMATSSGAGFTVVTGNNTHANDNPSPSNISPTSFPFTARPATASTGTGNNDRDTITTSTAVSNTAAIPNTSSLSGYAMSMSWRDNKPIAQLLSKDFEYFMVKHRIIVGRNSSNGDVDVNMGHSSFISREHLEISFEHPHFYLKCGGKNGIFIDNVFQKRELECVRIPYE